MELEHYNIQPTICAGKNVQKQNVLSFISGCGATDFFCLSVCIAYLFS